MHDANSHHDIAFGRDQHIGGAIRQQFVPQKRRGRSVRYKAAGKFGEYRQIGMSRPMQPGEIVEVRELT